MSAGISPTVCARCEENNLISLMGKCGGAVLKFHSVRGLSIKTFSDCVLKRFGEGKVDGWADKEM